MYKMFVKTITIIAGILVLDMCSGLSERDQYILRNRIVKPLIADGKSLKIQNKSGTLNIKSLSEKVRLVDWGSGKQEVMLSKHDWGKSSFDNMVNPISSGYISGGAGFIGNGGITRVVYTEQNLIFENDVDRNIYINYPFNKNIYDMKILSKNMYGGFSFDTDREQISISLLKLEVIR
jgi:hypothetical protein